jgi:hypothetical protein
VLRIRIEIEREGAFRERNRTVEVEEYYSDKVPEDQVYEQVKAALDVARRK